MNVCLLCVLCVVTQTSLRRADHSSRGSYRLWRVVMCDQEISRYEEAIARAGLQSQRNFKKIQLCGLRLLIRRTICGLTPDVVICSLWAVSIVTIAYRYLDRILIFCSFVGADSQNKLWVGRTLRFVAAHRTKVCQAR
jgi:hypothetical protein